MLKPGKFVGVYLALPLVSGKLGFGLGLYTL